MKNYCNILLALMFLLGLCSCSDLLDTSSDHDIVNPSLSEKTDSMFYQLGILKGVQQLADQYVLVGEMRGDLTATNSHTSADLRALADFSAGAANKYDSAYVYYQVINNCNYFIAHRDTTLMTGSVNVSMNEYVEAKAVRAWTYMQLAKTYGTVPFYTYPVTTVEEAERAKEQKDISGICDALASDLAQYSGYEVPSYGTNVSIGTTNSGSTKYVNYAKAMFPVDLVLGDLYLEAGQYERAAQSYYAYLNNNRLAATQCYLSTSSNPNTDNLTRDFNGYTYPSNVTTKTQWNNIFSMTASPDNVITYIPMAVNKLKGEITRLPEIFGYDFYSTTKGSSERSRALVDRQIDPSEAYLGLADAQDFYYVPTSSDVDGVRSAQIGDLRRYATVKTMADGDSTFTIMTKYESANIPVYRTNGVYLRLAEALNRMGYPDAAFAIIKDGINSQLLADTTYVRTATKEMLQAMVPTMVSAGSTVFAASTGIHSYGSGYTYGQYSPFQYKDAIAGKLEAEWGRAIDTESFDFYGSEAIEAVESIICDEMALELAFEGNRFGDLCRMARHKNEAAVFGSNCGGDWLARKLAYKRPAKDLTVQANWYLPMK